MEIRMSFKKRLVVAFLILILVPTGLVSVCTYSIIRLQKDAAVREYNNQEIVAFVETKAAEAAPLRVTVWQSVFFIGLIVFITAVVLLIWLYSSVIRPLNVLTRATQNLKNGNLDFKVTGDPDDELGQLCMDFEEMRVHLKEQIDARLQYEKDTVELISNISHDLKTPLTAIKGYAEGILDGVADTPEKQNKYIRTIYTKASDMSVLVDELSFYTKVDSNIVTYNFEKLDIDAYFTDCVDEQSLDMEVKNIRLTYESATGEDCRVAADPEQLRRVVNNIIGNSVKYMDKPEGIIRIRACRNEGFVRISITDNGSGIDEKDLPYVFDRFYRADASRNSSKGGSGLGLAIAKKIIEDHGGEIWAQSGEDGGTAIVFTLPLWDDEKKETVEEIEDAEYTEVPARGLRNRSRQGGDDGQNTDN